jgi:hypothetical protein
LDAGLVRFWRPRTLDQPVLKDPRLSDPQSGEITFPAPSTLTVHGYMIDKVDILSAVLHPDYFDSQDANHTYLLYLFNTLVKPLRLSINPATASSHPSTRPSSQTTLLDTSLTLARVLTSITMTGRIFISGSWRLLVECRRILVGSVLSSLQGMRREVYWEEILCHAEWAVGVGSARLDGR